MLPLCPLDATAALQHLELNRGNRRSPRTTSPNMQTAPLPPSHQQKMHQARVLPGRGVASCPLQHSPPNFQHLPHKQPGLLHANQTNQLPLRHRRALQPKKLHRKHLHPLRAKRQKNGSKVTTLRLASPPASPPSFRRYKLSQVRLARSFVGIRCNYCLLYTSPSPRD